jgi:prepilin-type processing-associated H-X9-DG protein
MLMAILIPAVARARQSAGTVACAANLRQWATAALQYAQQNNGYLPRRGQGAQPTGQIDRPSDWFNALPAIFQMKSFSELAAANELPRPGGPNSVWTCPAATENNQKYFFSYGMNMRLSTWNVVYPDRINNIGGWTTLVFMADAPGLYCSVLPANAPYSPVARHLGRVNIAFLDGHVTSYTGAEAGCGKGDPQRADIRWVVPSSSWAGPGPGTGSSP